MPNVASNPGVRPRLVSWFIPVWKYLSTPVRYAHQRTQEPLATFVAHKSLSNHDTRRFQLVAQENQGRGLSHLHGLQNNQPQLYAKL